MNENDYPLISRSIIDVEKYVTSHLFVLTGEKDIASSAEACSAYENTIIDRTRHTVDASTITHVDTQERIVTYWYGIFV